ncbi:hypothetical protein FOA43_003865 [Brettanomyces nanus]|uniref:DNA repair and recombination protein RAD52 n=1 Tax=Eeniella nana TaxID=13502 RepID=A0A875S5A2_EENNA|nr:uncharacterized protein FOA43_003865 [Brettanomyces nanus]QPG76476.1 hypothetical protein FOA43_003865 [Brettanomyces nanus]
MNRADRAQKNVGYTQEELTRIKKALEKQLGPEFISKRKGPGYNSIQYLEGWKAINLANSIFGPNGWCTELRNFQVDYIDERGGSISMGLSAIVRVSLKDGTYHEDIGYGSIDNCRTKSAAFDKCKKEAVTDGMKRALRQFGNALGNCLYDKDFLSKVIKVSQPLRKFDERNLMRVPVKDEASQPGPPSSEKGARMKEKCVSSRSVKSVALPNNSPSNDLSDDSFMFSDDWPEEISQNNNNLPGKAISDSEPEVEEKDGKKSKNAAKETSQAASSSIPANVTFVCAKSAEAILKDPSLQATLKYDPNHQSQISKSRFINHSTSAPVKRSIVTGSKHRDDNKENTYTSSKGKRDIGLPSKQLQNKRLHK